jgi:imidazolonepropionase-like amidohydrolase
MRVRTLSARSRGVAVMAALAALLVLTQPSTFTQSATIAITGAKLHPVSGPAIAAGTIVISGGKITAIGADVPAPAGATTIDAKGGWVTPGLVNAATTLGLVDIGAVRDTNDARAKGERAIAAAFRAWEGLNPASVLWAPARAEGVTGVVVLPSGGLIAGQAAFVDTLGGTKAEMVRRGPVAMVANVGSAAAAETNARGELALRFRELLEDTRVYASKKLAFESANTRAFAAGRLDLDAMLPVVEGKLPLVAAVDRASDIEMALDLAAEFKLRLVVLGGAEAWQVASRLASAKVPVLTTALDNIPTAFTELGSRQENAALLRRAGVTVALIVGPGEAFNVRNIRQHAGNAVAYGMSWDDALRAVTLSPAEIFGVEAAVGSLQVGREASLVLWDGDPFELSTRAVRVWVRGQEDRTPSRQDMLTQRYAPKP